MVENGNNSNEINSIMIARNAPVGLVVGAAGFLGSHLSEGLLKKHIQVIGVDNFSSGSRENLQEATKSSHFHLLDQNASRLFLSVPRLDYIFIACGEDWDVASVLNLAKKHRAKLVLVSSIEAYDRELSSSRSWLKRTESEIAGFAEKENLNARVVRLAGVFGPRMNLNSKDPLIRLIRESVQKSSKQTEVMDFSTRDLYISDTVELIIKSMLSGSTAMKIFDGALPDPIKLSEIKQVLLNPTWHKERNFEFSILPPWPSPNLDKTLKFLSWKPKADFLEGLRETRDYFSNRDLGKDPFEDLPKIQLEPPKIASKPEKPKPEKPQKTYSFFGILFKFFITLVVGYGLLWQVGSVAWNAYKIQSSLTQAKQDLSQGKFEQGIENLETTKRSIVSLDNSLNWFEFLRKFELTKGYFDNISDTLDYASQLAGAAEQSTLGMQSLHKGLKALTGELTEDSGQYFTEAQARFGRAGAQIDKVTSVSKRENRSFSKLEDKLQYYGNLVNQGRAVAGILPELTGAGTKKSYLVLLQNNNELRPTGGFIGSVARIDLEGGKLKKVEVQDVYNIDGQLNLDIKPPKELGESLKINNWYLRDANWEADFPTSARQAEWFYTKETGLRVDGVIGLNLSAIEDLLSVVGPLKLADYNEEVSSSNIFAKSIAHAEQGFFPGSQAKKNFISATANELINKLFFVPNQNWPGITASLGRSIEQKHLMFYLNEPKLFSYVVGQGWSGMLPRPSQSTKKGEYEDFLSVVEANLSGNKVNYYLDRSFGLETSFNKDGEISHHLKITYLNRSSTDAWPGGGYKNYFRIYLPFGAKLTRAEFDGKEIISQANAFVDYGRSGYGIILEVPAKSSRALKLEYKLNVPLSFKEGKLVYKLDVIKQGGTLKDPFSWQLVYPINYKLESGSGRKLNSQTFEIATDLSTNKSFEVSVVK